MAETTTADLTDDQIEKLLQEAETRLSSRKSGSHGDVVPSGRPSGELVSTSKPKNESKLAASISSPALQKPHGELTVRNPELPKSKKESATKPDAGSQWFNMPKTDLTPELKRDLQLLKMREVLDPKRFYRKDASRAAVPTYSHVGTMVESPTEWFSARMTKKERKRTLLGEVLDGESENRRFKRKYGEIQTAKTSGRKGHYKKMMTKRYGRKG